MTGWLINIDFNYWSVISAFNLEYTSETYTFLFVEFFGFFCRLSILSIIKDVCKILISYWDCWMLFNLARRRCCNWEVWWWDRRELGSFFGNSSDWGQVRRGPCTLESFMDHRRHHVHRYLVTHLDIVGEDQDSGCTCCQ